MKRISSEVLFAASLIATGANGQQRKGSFALRPVVTPHTIIDNQVLGNCVSLASPVLNDLGDFAFTAFCSSRGRLFTSHRIVATSGDHIDGKFIQSFYRVIAINDRGQVLYEAFFSDTDDYDMWNGHDGLFLDQHLLSIVEYDAGDRSYSYGLSEDGRVTAEIVDPAVQPKTGELGKTPPFSSALHGAATSLRQVKRGAVEGATDPFPFAVNRRGEFLMSVEPSEGQRFLLLASPVKH
jgi:hypothetical protein